MDNMNYFGRVHKVGYIGTVAGCPRLEVRLIGQKNWPNGSIYAFARTTIEDVPPSIPVEQTYGTQCIDPSGAHAENPTGCAGDPVNTATGAYLATVTDLALPGIGLPFSLRRSYTSADTSTSTLGVGWKHNLGASLTVRTNGDVEMTADDGQRVVYYKNDDGTFTPALGARSILSSTTSGFRLIRKNQVVYDFDSTGKLTSLTDRNGNDIVLAYTNGLLSTVTDTVGRQIVFTHTSGKLTDVDLPDGRDVHYGYTNGLLTSVEDVRGGITQYEYDSGARLNKVIDQEGRTVVRTTYGTNGRVVEQWDGANNKTTFTWDAASQTSTMTDARGNAWKDVYTGNVLVKRIDPAGDFQTFTYTLDINLSASTDARGNVTKMAYDRAGNLVSKKAPAPLGYEEKFTYDAKNNVTSYMDGRGKKTFFDYDANGNLVKIRAPENRQIEFTLDPAGTGLPVAVKDARGNTTSLGYDADGNLDQVTTPGGDVTTQDYDPSGRPVAIVDPRGNEAGANPADYDTILTYDASNHLVSRTDPLGHQQQWTYDLSGRLENRTDAKLRSTSYFYDGAGRLASVKDPLTHLTSYSYDAVGNLVSRTDAKNHTTTYGDNTKNLLSSVTSPLSAQWTYAYDKDGNLTSVEDAAGNATALAGDGKTNYSYDALNRLTSVDFSDSAPDASYSYDANGNRTSMTDGLGTVSYTYDDLDQLKTASRGSRVFAYSYDLDGHVTQRGYPDGTTTSYTWDVDGRLSSVTHASMTSSYAYDAAGNLLETALPASTGRAHERVYDRAGRLIEMVEVAGSIETSTTFQLDEVGNPTSETTGTDATTYSYDPLDRIEQVCYPGGCGSGPGADFITYAYDDVGNRTSETKPYGTTSYSYNAGDQLVSTTSDGQTRALTYDANGDLTANGARTFTYDVGRRMTSTTLGSQTTTYAYDGDGRRASVTDGPGPGDVTQFEWDANGAVPQVAVERDGSGALLRRYVRGLQLISVTDGTSSSYYQFDRLGSVTGLSDEHGAATWSYTYEPFGVARSAAQIMPGASESPMRFAGEYLDSSSLYHLRARQYDPHAGRFVSPDPWPSAAMDPYVSSYLYTNNRPTVLVDPLGLFGWSSFADAMNVVSAIASGVALVGATVAVIAGAPVVLAAGVSVAGLAGAAGAVSVVTGTAGMVGTCFGGSVGECGGSVLMTAVNWGTGGLGALADDLGNFLWDGAGFLVSLSSVAK